MKGEKKLSQPPLPFIDNWIEEEKLFISKKKPGGTEDKQPGNTPQPRQLKLSSHKMEGKIISAGQGKRFKNVRGRSLPKSRRKRGYCGALQRDRGETRDAPKAT